MKVCVTGHRPQKMYGFNLNHPDWLTLKEKFKMLLLEFNETEVYTGMALGTDTIFALATLELKQMGHPIKLTCVLPCKNQQIKWKPDDKERYEQILNRADQILYVSEDTYRVELMQKRNEWLVDHSDIVIAVWDGNKSGTGNCVQYALSKKKKIWRIQP